VGVGVAIHVVAHWAGEFEPKAQNRAVVARFQGAPFKVKAGKVLGGSGVR
jgi:hypothetical protein